MNLKGLSFESMPQLAVPFRFFQTAPFFAILAGLLLLISDPILLSSRWTNLLLAVTHTITIGFMMMVMIGALFQVLPVVVGISIPKAPLISQIIHFLTTLGAIGLVSGFYFQQPSLLFPAAIMLVFSIALFLIALLSKIRSMRNTPTSLAIKLSALSLAITIILGVSISAGWFNPSWFPTFRSWTNIHLTWGLLGWCILLVMGVSYQIIPMFYVTPDFPNWLTKGIPCAVFAQIIALTLIPLFLSDWALVLEPAVITSLALTIAFYCAYTLNLFHQRKRKSQDITVWFWRFSLTNLLLVCFLLPLSSWLELTPTLKSQLELIIANMTLVGFAMALITGMLLKIVPFLVWLNLQQEWIKRPTPKMPLKNMHVVIPTSVAKVQFILYFAFYLTFLISLTVDNTSSTIKLAALAMIACFSHLAIQIIRARHLYFSLREKMRQEAPRPNVNHL